MKRFLWIVLLSTTTIGAYAQLKSQAEKPPMDVRAGITTPVHSLFGLFSPDRFFMTQSYGVSFYTGGGQNGSLGMYSNSMNFRLSNPLFLRVNTGIQHQPFGGPKNSPNQNAQFLHGAELIYKPSKSFQMNLGYSNHPYYSGMGWYNSPFIGNKAGTVDDYEFGGNR